MNRRNLEAMRAGFTKDELIEELEAELTEVKSCPNESWECAKEQRRLEAENARLQKLVDMNQRVVDAARDHKRLDAHVEQCMCPICASIRELDGEKKPSDTCECGHQKSAHIYEEGACRPGFKCEQKCDYFTAKR